MLCLSNLRHALVAVVAALLLAPLVPSASAGTALVVSSPAPAADANTLETQQFHIENARLPGRVSARQTLTAWQVNHGSWNGQTLDGLSIVIVNSTPETGRSAQACCYVSHQATQAQRDALLAALLATQPQLLANQDTSTLRLEPAVITIEIDANSVTLHLGLIA